MSSQSQRWILAAGAACLVGLGPGLGLRLSVFAGETAGDAMQPGSDFARESPGPSAQPAAATMVPATAPAAQQVSIDNFSFSPKSITVPVGTSITWVNHDDVPHTVTSKTKAFASKAMDTDEKFTYVFQKPGTYTYYCAVHPHMTATVIVK
jgi:plastocyanin